jgi:uncharacterized protein YigA (DUF484 family)
MSKQQTNELAETAITEADVAAYLQTHAEFFDTHPELLAELKLRHRSGNAISLIERQVEVLRQQKRELDDKLRNLIQIARENDSLNKRLQKMTLSLMETNSFNEVIAIVQDALHHDFSADKVVIRLFRKPLEEIAYGNVGHIERHDSELTPFDRFLDSRKPVCGQLNKEQSSYLFGDDAGNIRSAALVALCDSGCFGMLAIGSEDPKRFHAAMGTLFLTYMGELIGHSMSQYLEGA